MNISYTYLTPDGSCIPAGGVARTITVAEDILADVDADGKLLGIEVLSDRNWLDGLTALAMTGRLYVL